MRLRKYNAVWLLICFFAQSTITVLKAQGQKELISDSATVEECLRYAFRNQPLVRQLKLDEAISRQNVRIALSDWFPQINATANLQTNLKLPVIYLPDFTNLSGPKVPITTGVKYNSGITFRADQTIFDRDVYIPGKTVGLIRTQAGQTTENALTNLVVQISKAYYDVLLSVDQLQIINEDIDRLTKIQQDANARFKSGASDNVDYRRATISLNNALVQKKSAEEAIKSRESLLKQLMGYPEKEALQLKNNTGSMESEVLIDTLQDVRYTSRPEYKLLQTNLGLQKTNVLYNKLGFLPSLSGFANYNINYQDDIFNDLYKKSFPNSVIGLSLNFPIFQGSKRIQSIKKSNFEYQRLALDTLRLRDEISSQYVQAMSEYKSSLAAYRTTIKNIETALDIYNTIKLQYNQGVKAYLEVIVAEADLMSARINNLNALYMLIFSKLDVQQALGQIAVNY
jgi:outer membrane protein